MDENILMKVILYSCIHLYNLCIGERKERYSQRSKALSSGKNFTSLSGSYDSRVHLQ